MQGLDLTQIQREQQRLADNRKVIYGGSDYANPKDGRNVYRILPPWPKARQRGLVKLVYFHIFMLREESESFRCLSMTYPDVRLCSVCGKFAGFENNVQFQCDCPGHVPVQPYCPICESLNRAKEKEREKGLGARTKIRGYANVFSRNSCDDPNKVYIYGFTSGSVNWMLKQIGDPISGPGDVTDLVNGRDVVITASNVGTQKAKYEIAFSFTPSPAHLDPKLIESLPKMLTNLDEKFDYPDEDGIKNIREKAMEIDRHVMGVGGTYIAQPVQSQPVQPQAAPIEQQVASFQNQRAQAPVPPQPPAPPTPPPPPKPPIPPAPPQTPVTVDGCTYEQFKAAGWSDDAMLANERYRVLVPMDKRATPQGQQQDRTHSIPKVQESTASLAAFTSPQPEQQQQQPAETKKRGRKPAHQEPEPVQPQDVTAKTPKPECFGNHEAISSQDPDKCFECPWETVCGGEN